MTFCKNILETLKNINKNRAQPDFENIYIYMYNDEKCIEKDCFLQAE